MDSTPGSFELPQLGFASFRCATRGSVQPFFDMHDTTSEEMITIQSGSTVRRNFTIKTVGHYHGHPLREVHYAPATQLALPFGQYRTVTFTVHQGTEARALNGRIVAQFPLAVSAANGAPRTACYVKHWNAQETAKPYAG